MFYILYRRYIPNTAVSNRLLAFARGFSELGIETEVVMFSPNENYDKIGLSLPNVHFNYCWERHYINRGVLKYISIFSYMLGFVRKLNKGDKVMLMGGTDILPLLLKKKGIDIYVERTEHPDVIAIGNAFFKVTPKQEIDNYKRIKGLFVITSALKRYYIENGIRNDIIHIINIVTDVERFKNLKRASVRDRYIAYCGTVSNNKDGVDELIKAFAITAKSHPDVKLYIIGPIPKKEEEKVNLKLIDDLGISDQIVFTGLVPAKQMPQLLKNAEVLALDRPDNMQAKYGFATKMGEYLLSERPVVVTKVGDFPLFFKDGESALLANPSDANDFATKLNWALDNPKAAERIGKRGAEVAMREFNYITESKKIADVIFNSSGSYT